MAEIDVLVRRAWERRQLARENALLHNRLSRVDGVPEIITQYAPMQAVLQLVEPRGQERLAGAHLRRVGHGKGVDRPRAASPLRARRRPARGHQLRGDRRRADRDRAVRLREGGIRRGRRAEGRPVRAGWRRHAVHGRRSADSSRRCRGSCSAHSSRAPFSAWAGRRRSR